jgi:threonine/homoserine/homoserine lactone efflux protein
MSHLLAFLGVAALVIATPGPDTALTVRNTLAGGRRAGAWTAVGVSAGQAVWALFTAAGVTALLAAAEPALLVVRYAGAAYLVWLGLRALAGAVRPGWEDEPGAVPARRLDARAARRQGLLSNLANPKMAAFFPSLLPQFASDFPTILALGLLFAALTLAWLTAYACAVARAGAVLRRPAVRRATEALTGAALVALGLRLAAERR